MTSWPICTDTDGDRTLMIRMDCGSVKINKTEKVLILSKSPIPVKEKSSIKFHLKHLWMSGKLV